MGAMGRSCARLAAFLWATVLAGQDLTGVVRDSSGQEIPGTRVALDGARMQITRRDGHFTFTRAAPGSHQLIFAVPGFRERRMTLEIATANVDLGTITLDLQDASIIDVLTDECRFPEHRLAPKDLRKRATTTPLPAGLGFGGKARMILAIAESGAVNCLGVDSGDAILIQSARSALVQWRFRPGEEGRALVELEFFRDSRKPVQIRFASFQ
jgi:hypothetical protein